jgi:NAD(P)-dependent dehydrogenase (short-subunit alcohol dehydrogenase family)
MLSRVENRYQTSSTPWKPQINSKTVVFAGDANGVGHAAAVMLASHGAPVFLATSSVAALKQAFIAINRAGGECDGMVVDCSRVEECRRFFLLAEAWLGEIDAVITPATGQYLCMQEAIRRMQVVGRGHLINIELPGESSPPNRSQQRMVSVLRRQAREAGIRVTLIEPESGDDLPGTQAVARCVLESMAQPFGTEVVLVPGRVKPGY